MEELKVNTVNGTYTIPATEQLVDVRVWSYGFPPRDELKSLIAVTFPELMYSLYLDYKLSPEEIDKYERDISSAVRDLEFVKVSVDETIGSTLINKVLEHYGDEQ